MAAFAAAEAKVNQSLVVGPGPCAWPYVRWELSRYLPSARQRASPNVNMRWNWIEILPAPIPLSDLARFVIGRAEETEAHIAEALRLSPRDTMAYTWLYIAGVAKLYLGSCEQAVAWFRRRSRPTETIRWRIFAGAASRSLVDWPRRVPPSKPASRSTHRSPSPAPAPAGRR